MRKTVTQLIIAISAAALLWFYMFSPWTQGRPGFWLVMSFSALVLTGLGLAFTPDRKAALHFEKPFSQLQSGVFLAFILWGVFWVGDLLSAKMFIFARPQVDSVYAMKDGFPSWLIAVLLIVLIGPAEEFFWRGYVQRTLSKVLGGKHAQDFAFLITTAVYALVHVWSFNFMLVMAAMVAGAFWGIIYRFHPKALGALIVSHALWDVLVFILMPI